MTHPKTREWTLSVTCSTPSLLCIISLMFYVAITSLSTNDTERRPMQANPDWSVFPPSSTYEQLPILQEQVSHAPACTPLQRRWSIPGRTPCQVAPHNNMSTTRSTTGTNYHVRRRKLQPVRRSTLNSSSATQPSQDNNCHQSTPKRNATCTRTRLVRLTHMPDAQPHRKSDVRQEDSCSRRP